MRYFEFVAERDDSKTIANLRNLIDHPDTTEDERKAAERALARIEHRQKQTKKKEPEARNLDQELPDFGGPRTYTKSGKLGKSHLPDFGKVDIKV